MDASQLRQFRSGSVTLKSILWTFFSRSGRNKMILQVINWKASSLYLRMIALALFLNHGVNQFCIRRCEWACFPGGLYLQCVCVWCLETGTLQLHYFHLQARLTSLKHEWPWCHYIELIFTSLESQWCLLWQQNSRHGAFNCWKVPSWLGNSVLSEKVLLFTPNPRGLVLS